MTTTNEQAEYTPTEAEVRRVWTKAPIETWNTQFRDPGALDRFLARVRREVAEQCAQIAEDKYRFDHGVPSTPGRAIAVAIRAAFPAAGGSTPAVDGEEGRYLDTSVRSLSYATGGNAVPDSLPLDGFKSEAQNLNAAPVVSSSPDLPLDPKPYVRDDGWRHASTLPLDVLNGRGYGFDPHPGFSRDESRYREGAGEACDALGCGRARCREGCRCRCHRGDHVARPVDDNPKETDPRFSDDPDDWTIPRCPSCRGLHYGDCHRPNPRHREGAEQ